MVKPLSNSRKVSPLILGATQFEQPVFPSPYGYWNIKAESKRIEVLTRIEAAGMLLLLNFDNFLILVVCILIHPVSAKTTNLM